MSKIERSNQRNKFSDSELSQLCAKSKAYDASPAGQAQKRQLALEALHRARNPRGIRFPDLAKNITGRSTDSRQARVAILQKQAAALPIH